MLDDKIRQKSCPQLVKFLGCKHAIQVHLLILLVACEAMCVYWAGSASAASRLDQIWHSLYDVQLQQQRQEA